MRKYAICKKFGKRVKALRRAAGLSQEAFADLVKIHRTYAGKIERGESNPPLRTIERISKTLKVPLHKLFEF